MTDQSVYVYCIIVSKSKNSLSKRDEIIEVASKLFYEQGYHCTGIQQIIQEAGAAKGTFYSHFKSKEELGIAWLKARHRTWNHWLLQFINPKKTPKSKIVGIFDFLGQWMQDANFRGCAFLNTMCETPDCENALRLEISNHKRELFELFRALTAEHHATKTKIEQEQIATTLFILFEGTLIQLQNFQDLSFLQVAKKQVTALL